VTQTGSLWISLSHAQMLAVLDRNIQWICLESHNNRLTIGNHHRVLVLSNKASIGRSQGPTVETTDNVICRDR